MLVNTAAVAVISCLVLLLTPSRSAVAATVAILALAAVGTATRAWWVVVLVPAVVVTTASLVGLWNLRGVDLQGGAAAKIEAEWTRMFFVFVWYVGMPSIALAAPIDAMVGMLIRRHGIRFPTAP